ncbi:MAG: DUF86 domain-containing protein [Coriobacteriales bacterium]|jgi:uncharacterized protein with HEPN domain|nr:DUF86 domain-containing protein [Coriobacteriales bacterium]
MDDRVRNKLLIAIGFADRIATTLKRAKTQEGFIQDYDLQYSVVHSISQIAENLAQVLQIEPGLSDQILKFVPYRSIRRMRDKIQHHYGTIDPDIVWGIASQNVPELKLTLEEFLSADERQSETK